MLKWKAAQFRLCALYVECVVFKESSIDSKTFFLIFLDFFTALRLMVTDNQSENIKLMRHHSINFVEGAKSVYEPSFVSHNLHHFTHLANAYKAYCNL